MSAETLTHKDPLPSLGEVAYAAYCEHRSWVGINGEELPEWDDQNEDLRDAWETAAHAAVHEARDRSDP